MATAPPPPPEVGVASADDATHFGKYIRVAHLGEGGMGEVWKAWDTELHRWVALKFPRFEGREDLERLRQEAQSAGQLNHPNIAAVFEFGQAQGRHFIAMAYVEGEPLSRFPRKDRKRLVGFVRQAALAVASAHTQGVIHRDLKPENLMVGREGEHIYVMDFGIARRTTGTLTSTSAGTPPYMSPEQIQGKRIDGRSDVWSLGATLYELLADRLPFEGNSGVDVARKILESEPLALRHVDPDLNTIVMKCLEKDPPRRYATAQELADDLARALHGDAIAAHPPSLVYRVRKRLGKRKLAVLATFSGSVAIVLLALAVSASVRKQSQIRSRLAEAKQAQTESRLLKALTKFKEVLAIDPGNGDARSSLEHVEREMARARGLLDDALDRLASLDRVLTKDLAVESLQSELQAARSRIREVLAIFADFPDALLALARSHLMLFDKERDKAGAYCDEAIDADSTFAQAYLLRALVNAEKYEVMNHVSPGQAKASETSEGKRLLASVVADVGSFENLVSDHRRIEYCKGILDFAEQRYQASADRLRKVALPSDYLAWRLIGHALVHAQQFGEAIPALTRALDFRPRDVASRQWRANASAQHARKLRAEGRQAEADQTLATALADYEQLPQTPQIMFHRAMIHYEREEWESAVEAFTKFLQEAPEDPYAPFALNNRGVAYQRKKEHAKAIADFTAALAVNPRDAAPHVGLGEVYLELGRLDLANDHFQKGVELNSAAFSAWGAFKSWTRALVAKGDLLQAFMVQKTAMELSPTDPYPVLHSWYLGLLSGRSIDEVSGILRRAGGRFTPGKWPHALWRLYLGEGSVDESLRAASMDDKKRESEQLCEATYYIALWHLTREDKSSARQWLEKCIEIRVSHFAEYALAKAWLQRLR